MTESLIQGHSRSELEAVIAATPFAQLLHVRLQDYSIGRVSLVVPLRADLMMHMNYAHGAVIGFMADSACAWAAASVAGNVVTAEYKLNLLAPGVGDALLARGEMIKSSGRLVTCRSDIFALAGDRSVLVATALATVMKVR
jgi:uncharacterized protein (TIGR00369 family)